MYKLVYIKGISRYDTWKFASKQEQYNYFDSLVGVSINDYYPPHYTNTIKLELSQVDYNDVNYNYLLLSFNNKYYCYFIDSIEYINEDLYSIKITMDTIQTYMFDINFLQSNITRKSIDRYLYDSDTQTYSINRNYIRENLSKGNFVFKEQLLFESNLRYIIIYSTEKLTSDSVGARPDTQVVYDYERSEYITTSSNLYVYILPILIDSRYINNTGKEVYFDSFLPSEVPHDTGCKLHSYYDIVNNFSGCKTIVNMIMCNNKVLDEICDFRIFVDNTNNTITFKSNHLNVEEGTFGIPQINTMYAFRLPALFRNYFYGLDMSVGHNTMNRSLNVLKNSSFVPQLIDENYIKAYFGEKSNYNQIPLYQLKETGNMRCHFFFDIMTCDRTYWVSKEYDTLKDDLLNIIVCNSDEGMVLKNTPWQDYIAQNKATYTDGFKLAKDLNLLNFEMGLTKTATAGMERYLTTGSPSSRGSSFTGEIVGQVGSYFINQYSIDANHRILTDNLMSAPQESKQGNSYSNDLYIKSNAIIQRIETVSDIDNVALEYENEGYAVNEIKYNENILDYTNRHYYNIIQARDIRFDLSVLSTNDIKNDIRTRIESGLRLWNKSHNTNILDNIIYDNVETNLVEE